jgi:endonuclease/exonuclease/phosphatase family metal-dependent hydrolase
MNSPDFELVLHPDPRTGPRPVSRRDMDAWRRNVGPPLVLDHRSSGSLQGPLLVLSWNVWIGRGRLGELIGRIRAGEFAAQGAEPGLPFVALIQEGYRRDPAIPAEGTGAAGRVLVAGMGVQEDLADAARTLGLNLRYAPSMRNSTTQSDRGNAILSSLPLEEAQAIELPLVLQRRVAVTAVITVGGLRLRLVSAHLDPRGPPGHQWSGAAGRAVQARHLMSAISGGPVILGADLNLGRGRYEPAWRVLRHAGFTFGVPPTTPAWRHTFHALPRLVLDYVLIRDPGQAVHRAKVHRLDEHPRDRGPRVFGSDHHPLLARIEFHPRKGESS